MMFDVKAPLARPVSSCIMPVIENIVATVSVGRTLDLHHVARNARNVEYQPSRFGALIMRRREPKSTALVFGTGKLVVLGPKSQDVSRLAARKHARVLSRILPNIRFQNYRIHNIVARVVLPFAINLNTLAEDTGQLYEPEIFPGLPWKFDDPACTVLVFSNGKVVITGLKKTQDVAHVFSNVYKTLEANSLGDS